MVCGGIYVMYMHGKIKMRKTMGDVAYVLPCLGGVDVVILFAPSDAR